LQRKESLDFLIVVATEVLGCNLLVRAFGTPSHLVEAKLVCDANATNPAKVTYEVSFPDEGLRRWIQTVPPIVVNSGYTQFGTRAPFPPRVGPHIITVRANLTWVTREATCFVTSEPLPDWRPWE